MTLCRFTVFFLHIYNIKINNIVICNSEYNNYYNSKTLV